MSKKNFQPDKSWTEEMPSIPEMIKRFSRESIKWLKQGAPICSEEEYSARLNICQACPHLIADKMRCGKCGCKLQFKARMETARCPIQKWQEVKKK